MIDGILLINKERGISSYDVIRRLKKLLPKGQKIGHAGTLDPFASGLLIILLGKYTKKMEKILRLEKEYTVVAEFGYSTDTQDITGQRVKEKRLLRKVSIGRIEKVIRKNLLGKIAQLPPQFSAKKYKGKKAYEYARNGESVKLTPKNVNVLNFEVSEYNWPIITFRIVCSSGTYIRTLVNDLGDILKTYATAIELRRVSIGNYMLYDAINSEDILNGINIKSKVLKEDD